jgi:hypothetical protein
VFGTRLKICGSGNIKTGVSPALRLRKADAVYRTTLSHPDWLLRLARSQWRQLSWKTAVQSLPNRRKDKDASQKDSQIVCGFDRHIDWFTCARGADCAP